MKKNLYTLLWLSFLDILSFSFILPVLPFIIKDFGWWAIEISFCVSASAIWMFIGWMLFWRLSDKFWRKKILLISIISNIIWYLVFALSRNIEIFIFSRFICWLWWWWISVVQAFIGDISKEDERIKNMWLVWASIWLGFTLWPIFWWILDDIWLKNMWYISAFILFISLISSIFLLPDNEEKHSDEFSIKKTPEDLLIFFVTFFIVTASFAWIQTVFWLYLNEILNFTSKKVAYTFGYLWVIAIIYQWIIMQRYWSWLKEKTLIIFWLISLWLSFVLFPKVHNIYLLYIILAFFSIWLASTNSSIYALIGKHSHKKDYWKNMWINTAFWSISDIVWPLISWFLYVESYKFPFYLFWIVLLLNIVAVYFLVERKNS